RERGCAQSRGRSEDHATEDTPSVTDEIERTAAAGSRRAPQGSGGTGGGCSPRPDLKMRRKRAAESRADGGAEREELDEEEHRQAEQRHEGDEEQRDGAHPERGGR